MLPSRISAKLFLDTSTLLHVPSLIPVFHSWIRQARVPGVPIDVANYSHVQDGPSLLLVGHAGDYIIDQSSGRSGLRYLHKRDWPDDTFAARLQTTLDGLRLGVQLLENEPRLQPAVRFYWDGVELTFPDRLNTPNRAQTFSAIQRDVREVLASFFAVESVMLRRAEDDERLALTIMAHTQKDKSYAPA